MASWADRWDFVWFDTCLAVVLITGLTSLAMIQCRQPARRRVWGRAGLAMSLAAIPLAWLNPLPKIDLRHPSIQLWVVDPRIREVAVNPVTGEGLPDGPQVAASPRSSPQVQPDWSHTFRRGSLIAYGCGLMLTMSRLGLGLVGSRYLVKHAIRPSARSEALLAALPFSKPGGRRPSLLISTRSGRPVLIGFWRPVILIPPEFDQPGAEVTLRLGLLHELAHSEIDDHKYGLVATLAQAVWFFLPQVWWIGSQLRLDAEFLADHRAVEHFGTSQGYADSLVSLAWNPAATQPRAPLAVAADRTLTATEPTPASRAGGLASALFQRVQMLLKCPFEVEDRAPRFWSRGVTAIMLVGMLAACSVSIHNGRDGTDELGPSVPQELVRGFHIAELAIVPQLLADRPFNLRFHLPERFRLGCEVFAAPEELSQLEFLGYRLGARSRPEHPATSEDQPSWHRIEVVRESGGREAVHVDGMELIAPHRPARPASILTIRPISGRTTQLRDIRLVW